MPVAATTAQPVIVLRSPEQVHRRPRTASTISGPSCHRPARCTTHVHDLYVLQKEDQVKPGTAWIACVLLAVGVCGILDAAGLVDSSQTIGQWWPLAIVGWALIEMLGERRITLGGVICTAIGTTLLADTQQWASDAVVWSSLAIVIGLAILIHAGFDRADRDNDGDARTAVGGGAS